MGSGGVYHDKCFHSNIHFGMFYRLFCQRLFRNFSDPGCFRGTFVRDISGFDVIYSLFATFSERVRGSGVVTSEIF